MVRALQAMRGMALVAAATVIAELGDITRRQLMAYLGLVPSEHSSGATRRRRRRESREWRGPTNADRSRLGLSVPGARGEQLLEVPGKADPRHRVEGPGAAMSALSQLTQAGNHCRFHGRDRSRTGGFALGDRQTRSNR